MNVIRSAYVMKKILATFTLLAPLAGGLAQDKAEPAPNIVVKEPVYNFGEKDNNLSVEHTFEILNDGNVSLEISKTQTSCGCTVADLSQKVIPPGETATLKAVLSLKNKRGQQKKNITVHSNDPDTPTLQLILEGTATSLLTINPERVFMSGISQDDGDDSDSEPGRLCRLGVFRIKSTSNQSSRTNPGFQFSSWETWSGLWRSPPRKSSSSLPPQIQ